MYLKLLKMNKDVPLSNFFFLTCVKSWTRSIKQAFYIFTVIGQNQIALNKQFALKALHGLHKLKGLNTNTLNPGDLSEPSVIVYVWIGPQGFYQPFMSFLFFFCQDIFSGRWLNQWLSRQAGEEWKRENEEGRGERSRPTERKEVCVKDLEVEIENA